MLKYLWPEALGDLKGEAESPLTPRAAECHCGFSIKLVTSQGQKPCEAPSVPAELSCQGRLIIGNDFQDQTGLLNVSLNFRLND